MIIKPSSELRNNYNEVSRIVNEQQEPVFLTKNGCGDTVIMSIEQYNRMQLEMEKLELYKSLARSEADHVAGRVYTLDEVREQVKGWGNQK